MSCSKISSGDSPELAYEIMKYFKIIFQLLYSCILVNRLWWENLQIETLQLLLQKSGDYLEIFGFRFNYSTSL
ncbi:hypothetical protein RclHR1_09980006 [Rhizophagus clarus]|uniref:Uncharacterized protein n=1 Tax=Rhizophagus clarus TaxID=94130 RepID=A0A2Z6SJK2_9GLOM|nr:hypothetical protein RclHR1_09980006 [Rhizophagus clarus]